MNKTLEQVIEDIRQTMADEVSQVTLCENDRTAGEELAWQTLLAISVDSISVSSANTPLRADLMDRLRNQLKDHPEMLEAPDYPANIIKWVEEHLGVFDDIDLLGCYLSSQPGIELYWLSIVLCARRHKWLVTELTRVVLVHEWAHALTHLGADSDGHVWQTALFDRAETALIEGLAQYWTHYNLQTAGKENTYRVFLELMKNQPAPYRTHMAWIEKAGADMYADAGIRPAPGFAPNEDLICPIREHVRGGLLHARIANKPPSAKAFTEALGIPDIAIDQNAACF